jgi:hypothetical protein
MHKYLPMQVGCKAVFLTTAFFLCKCKTFYLTFSSHHVLCKAAMYLCMYVCEEQHIDRNPSTVRWGPSKVTRSVCEKIAQIVAQPIVWSNSIHKFYRRIKQPQKPGYFGNCKNWRVNNRLMGKNSPNQGVDVMITIFCDFSQFSAKNWRFIKNQCYDQIFS